ncbi:hypothetical protein FJ492_24115 [Mesorhizobium sp. B2-5-4]|uniref:hypothetical protein n=1 Tax=unclassified Mesorhizobium TaxID=325217 RepID=UPI001126FD4B|nr:MULTISPECIES: hypothetical protein [unclassified Mesorhizobium]TPJ83304.1 hypothetical protein FJ434_20090 [Mesorhizobium sp. B2-5-13]TPK38305.1 hypothetical protein FJ492_24115 [Mesorhizobium sp. B2-5-4]TPK44448.1 hypothetical protein FJ560_22980 [Mesorhizobium sp. B2-5-5]
MADLPDFDPSKIPQAGDQHDPKVRANQKAFQERFGDFKARHVTGIHLGPAPKGEWVGCIFDMEDGSTVQVAIPFNYWQAFGNEYVLAMMSASFRSRESEAPVHYRDGTLQGRSAPADIGV